ncbi:cupin domain-containing protein [Conexibacter stalactiti]|uniref:Cupin domain-containing protein n=1 Tax=Conexibacter stalactiti TaxID=1940611 RepID=A0ABU4HY89_9ACTN|nr:cupin domain-containing protein [Conexibacter stalactiti]MDW5598241.1 cupin domain-containing protein [Conexibacter stalactiti]MEC5038883.1 cupin domain-containing protein [Conexibacter stalactiti]
MRTIENPATGERLKWLVTSEESGGELVRAELWIRPGGGAAGQHVHRDGDEHVQLLAGRMELRIGRARRLLCKGDRATVPAGLPHCWRNVGADELHVIAELHPPLQFEQLTETVFALAQAGETGRGGRLRLLDAAVLHARYGDQLQLVPAVLPLPLARSQRLLLGALGPLAQRRLRSAPGRYETVTTRVSALPSGRPDTSR